MPVMMGAESVKFDVSLEVARDAERASLEFWRKWLWQSVESPGEPPALFCDEIARRYGVSCAEVHRQWLEWYEFLTSWELASLLVGADVRCVTQSYGLSHRRA